jgi:hypothetical protein
MNTQIKLWRSEIDEITKAFKEYFSGLKEEKLNQKPDPKRWSIAQNIAHLIKFNTSYFPAIESARKGEYKVPLTGKIGFFNKFFKNMLLSAVKPDRKKKIKTFKIWKPESEIYDKNILNDFINHQEELKKQISNSENLLEKNTVISSPAGKIITYPLSGAFEILIAHEKRHLEQARECLENIENVSPLQS